MKNQNTFREIMQTMGRIGGSAGFGLSVVTPLVVCILFGVWLRNRYGVGEWVILTAAAVGLVSSGCGAYRTIRAFVAEEERRDAKTAAGQPHLTPKRDPNEAWHVPAEPENEQENPQKLE